MMSSAIITFTTNPELHATGSFAVLWAHVYVCGLPAAKIAQVIIILSEPFISTE